MAKLTLARRDAYLSHIRSGIKPDNLFSLRTAPLHMATLFPDSVLKKAKEDIASYERKGHSNSSHKNSHYHPYERPKKSHNNSKSDKPAWKTIGSRSHGRKHKGKSSNYSSRATKGQSLVNDNHWVAPMCAW